MTKEKAITIIESHKAHWQRLLREKICDETEGRETIEGFDMAISALKEEPAPFDFELFQAGLMDMPKGMTNGEVMQALFPKMTVSHQSSNGVFTIVENFDSPYPQELYTEWWNAPYKAEKGGEE